MIIVNLTGGLGNQLFQYSAAKALGLKIKTPVKVNIAKFFSPGEPRAFQLREATEYGTDTEVFVDPGVLLTKYERLFKQLGVKTRKEGLYIVDEKDFFQYSLQQRNNHDLLMNGYFQDTSHFLGHKPSDLVTLRKFDSPLTRDQSRMTVGVHVRRGDYLLPKHHEHGIIPMDFYQTALEQLKREFASIFVVFFCDDEGFKPPFSVDLYARELMLTDVKEFLLLSTCNAFIISNSTFAWWAAALSGSKHVFAPKRWYRNRDGRDSFYLPGWHVL